jgi:hypothetical protein
VYDGPIIDGHTHPMLSIGDQMVAEPHQPERYRELVSDSAISRAVCSVHPADGGAAQAILHDNAAELLEPGQKVVG